jgi:hypothetical protein
MCGIETAQRGERALSQQLAHFFPARFLVPGSRQTHKSSSMFGR